MNSLRAALTDVRDMLGWMPNSLVALVILALAGAVALMLHRFFRRIVRQTLASRYPFAFRLVARTKGVSQLALLVLALIVALPVAPFDYATATLVARILLIAIIGLMGWAAITALDLSAEIYLSRFRMDVADNLLARKHNTQVRILLRIAEGLVGVFTIGAALMTFEAVRQYGVSLFASAGVAGIVAGLAARPILSNFFAGVQLAITQPIRIDDAVIVENEWGWIEEINSTFVVIRLWDWRRQIVPLTYFIEKPFQNWTREGSALIGSVMLYLDYRAPIAVIRDKVKEIAAASDLWDRQIVNVQVTDAKERTIEVRILVSARTAPATFDLRCEVREKLMEFLQREHSYALPTERFEASAELARNNAENRPAKRRRSNHRADVGANSQRGVSQKRSGTRTR